MILKQHEYNYNPIIMDSYHFFKSVLLTEICTEVIWQVWYLSAVYYFVCFLGEEKEGGWDWEQKKTVGGWPQTTSASQGIKT